MNNIAKNGFFWISKVKWLQYTGEMGNCTSYRCPIFSGFSTQKSLKSFNCWQSYYLKNKKVDVFGTQCIFVYKYSQAWHSIQIMNSKVFSWPLVKFRNKVIGPLRIEYNKQKTQRICYHHFHFFLEVVEIIFLALFAGRFVLPVSVHDDLLVRCVYHVICIILTYTQHHLSYRVGQKISPYQSISIKTCRRSNFFVKVECRTAEVNANKHLLVVNILSIKYSMYDVKSDVNYLSLIHISEPTRLRRIELEHLCLLP